ncbi:MAG TPA: aminoglycoside phosphotransferase family protein [Acidimicrobiales bacterium]|nr:aminoglycoside phosphotransferase family protein [Acidimicrobiales bacterium]
MADVRPLAEVVLAHSERAVVRLGDDVFVKVDVDHARIAREVAALSACPVPAPRVLWSQPGVVAVSAVPGVELATYGSPSPFGVDVWHRVGALVRQLHSTPVPDGVVSWFDPSTLRQWIEDLRAWLVAETDVDPALVDARADHAIEHLAGRDVPLVYCHGDLQCQHVFVADDERTLSIIDWADAGLADPAYDLAVLTANDPARADDVLAGYGAAVDRDVIAAYRSLRRLGGLKWMIEHGFDPTGDIAALSFLSN